MWNDFRQRISSRKVVKMNIHGLNKCQFHEEDDISQFNCSAEITDDGGADGAQCPGDPVTRKPECTAALIKLLEDLKATLLDSAKTRNPNIRESTIASVEAVLNQIRSRLNEPLIGASVNGRTSSASKSRHSDVSTVLREVEKSIKSLKEGSRSSQRASSPSIRPPSLKVNSLDVPSGGEVPRTSSLRKSGASYTHGTASKPYSTQAPSMITEIRSSGREEMPSTRASLRPESRRSSPASMKSTQSAVKSSRSRTSGKSPIEGVERTSSVQRSPPDGGSSSIRRSTKRDSAANDSISSKAASEPQLTEHEYPVLSRSGSAGGRLSHESLDKGQCVENGSRRSTLSKIFSTFRSHSRSKPSGSRGFEPIELCDKLLTICGANLEGSQLGTCSAEALYEKLLSMGPEGAEFLQDAQNYVNSTLSQQKSTTPSTIFQGLYHRKRGLLALGAGGGREHCRGGDEGLPLFTTPRDN